MYGKALVAADNCPVAVLWVEIETDLRSARELGQDSVTGTCEHLAME